MIPNATKGDLGKDNDSIWRQLMLMPEDYSHKALFDKETRALMEKISFAHGGKEYDDRYPDGIPTSVVITTEKDLALDSGLIMYPTGHARNTTSDLESVLRHKFSLLAQLAVKDVDGCLKQLADVGSKSSDEMDKIYNFKINFSSSKEFQF